ncbi:hypothetical protein GGQ99_004759 [Aminobacter niigataensis]|uniref:Uncharacterized protein n=1 Tax=Aminobacter niigataensis TaxID=83265 RepID=A0ABR6L8A9_9HYPH|nr:hypothetical protein [Aminobacter niigataensis]MBB4652975.1 hypothetical protein [Aminobacter niigataensis]
MTTPRILAIDAAAHFGWAYGPIGQIPRSGAQYFAKSGAGASYANIMLGAMRWTTEFLTAYPADYVVVERAVPDTGGIKNSTNYETSEMKNGLIGVIVATARLLKVRNPDLIIGDQRGEHRLWLSTVRAKFLPKKPKEDAAKPIIRQKCIDLGWISQAEALADKGFDRTDALANWYCACLLIDPRKAPPVDPLFLAAERRKREAEARSHPSQPTVPERF